MNWYLPPPRVLALAATKASSTDWIILMIFLFWRIFRLESFYIGIIIYLNNCLFTNWCDLFHKQQQGINNTFVLRPFKVPKVRLWSQTKTLVRVWFLIDFVNTEVSYGKLRRMAHRHSFEMTYLGEVPDVTYLGN